MFAFRCLKGANILGALQVMHQTFIDVTRRLPITSGEIFAEPVRQLAGTDALVIDRQYIEQTKCSRCRCIQDCCLIVSHAFQTSLAST